ncbi:hypothetical protein ACSBR2_022815 [Camellia fascicularis]
MRFVGCTAGLIINKCTVSNCHLTAMLGEAFMPGSFSGFSVPMLAVFIYFLIIVYQVVGLHLNETTRLLVWNLKVFH